jgi:hypothetical protein
VNKNNNGLVSAAASHHIQLQKVAVGSENFNLLRIQASRGRKKRTGNRVNMPVETPDRLVNQSNMLQIRQKNSLK